jgi:RNA-binding protein YhbY
MRAELVYVIGNTAILYRQQPDAEKRKIRLPR